MPNNVTYGVRKISPGQLPHVESSRRRPQADSPKIVSGFKFRPGSLRMTTVSLPPSRRTRKEPQSIVDSLSLTTKLLRWDEANEARPPLPSDLEGPGPQSYSQTCKPLKETNAPSFSFGRRCWPEKDSGGARSSWQKTWFHSSNIWCDKVDFHTDKTWPAPSSYRLSSFVEKNADKPQPPLYSMGKKFPFSIVRKHAEKDPAPNNYNLDSSLPLTHKSAAAFSHQFRRGGTQLWDTSDSTPGPGSYNIKYCLTQRNRPNYSMTMSSRKPVHQLGPFAAF